MGSGRVKVNWFGLREKRRIPRVGKNLDVMAFEDRDDKARYICNAKCLYIGCSRTPCFPNSQALCGNHVARICVCVYSHRIMFQIPDSRFLRPQMQRNAMQQNAKK